MFFSFGGELAVSSPSPHTSVIAQTLFHSFRNFKMAMDALPLAWTSYFELFFSEDFFLYAVFFF